MVRYTDWLSTVEKNVSLEYITNRVPISMQIISAANMEESVANNIIIYRTLKWSFVYFPDKPFSRINRLFFSSEKILTYLKHLISW